jgi:hypothetical protein
VNSCYYWCFLVMSICFLKVACVKLVKLLECCAFFRENAPCPFCRNTFFSIGEMHGRQEPRSVPTPHPPSPPHPTLHHRPITETKRINLVLFGMQNTTCCPCLAANNGDLTSAMPPAALPGDSASFAEQVFPLRDAAPASARFIFATASLPEHTFLRLERDFVGIAAAIGPGLHRSAPGAPSRVCLSASLGAGCAESCLSVCVARCRVRTRTFRQGSIEWRRSICMRRGFRSVPRPSRGDGGNAGRGGLSSSSLKAQEAEGILS